MSTGKTDISTDLRDVSTALNDAFTDPEAISKEKQVFSPYQYSIGLQKKVNSTVLIVKKKLQIIHSIVKNIEPKY